jgi:hypothetical protein
MLWATYDPQKAFVGREQNNMSHKSDCGTYVTYNNRITGSPKKPAYNLPIVGSGDSSSNSR